MASLPYPRIHQTIFPQKPQNLTQPNHLWASAKSVGGSSTPEISVNSVNSVGGLAEGGVGMAGMPYPPIIAQTGGLKFCVFCAICGRISQQEISVSICDICGRISQQEVSVGSANSVGGYARFAWLVQWRPLHPLVECKKCIDFFVVTKFHCIFAM